MQEGGRKGGERIKNPRSEGGVLLVEDEGILKGVVGRGVEFPGESVHGYGEKTVTHVKDARGRPGRRVGSKAREAFAAASGAIDNVDGGLASGLDQAFVERGSAFVVVHVGSDDNIDLVLVEELFEPIAKPFSKGAAFSVTSRGAVEGTMKHDKEPGVSIASTLSLDEGRFEPCELILRDETDIHVRFRVETNDAERSSSE